jgi:hypothetical protein
MELLLRAGVVYVFFDTHGLLDLYFDALWLFFDACRDIVYRY